MSYTKFALLFGIYDTDFTSTPQCKKFLIDFSPSVTLRGIWQCLRHNRSYELGLSKISFLTCLAHKYVHTVMAHSFTTRADTTIIVGRQELLFLYSITQSRPIHLGYIMANFIVCQDQHVHMGTIFLRLYTMRLIKGIGLADRL